MNEQKQDFRKMIEVLRRVGNGFTPKDLGKVFLQYHLKYSKVELKTANSYFNGEL